MIAEELVQFGVSAYYVGTIWRKHKLDILDTANRDIIANLKHKLGAGPPRKVPVEELHRRVKLAPFRYRKDIRTLADYTGIPKSTLHRALKAGLLKVLLTEDNKTSRIAYCKGFVEEDGCFSDMLDCVDIDEKWFYLTQHMARYILVPGEAAPHRTCKHKSHVEKVMCLTAIARPRKNPDTGRWWDGKIGTWFYVEQVAAQRTSKNRAKGTLIWKSFKVGRKESIEMYVTKLLPAIVEKWPVWAEKKVRIQQDNAPAHPKTKQLGIRITTKLAEINATGWDIQFEVPRMQPPNSPDCNTLDLAFFRAIQAIQYRKNASNIEELIAHVSEAFDELPLDVCRRVWTTAQMVMNEIIIANGDNKYKLPHASKEKAERFLGEDIPLRLPCRAIIDGGSLGYDTIIAYSQQQQQQQQQSKLIVVFSAIVHVPLVPPPPPRCAVVP